MQSVTTIAFSRRTMFQIGSFVKVNQKGVAFFYVPVYPNHFDFDGRNFDSGTSDRYYSLCCFRLAPGHRRV